MLLVFVAMLVFVMAVFTPAVVVLLMFFVVAFFRVFVVVVMFVYMVTMLNKICCVMQLKRDQLICATLALHASHVISNLFALRTHLSVSMVLVVMMVVVLLAVLYTRTN